MVASVLKGLAKAWKGAVIPPQMQGAFEPIPDGNYKTVIQSVTLGDSKKGNFQAAWTLKIVGGPLEGKTIRKFHALYASEKQSIEERLGWFKADLARFLAEEPSMEDLPEALKSLEGVEVDVKVVMEGEYQRQYFQNQMRQGVKPPASTSRASAPKGAKSAAQKWA